MLCWITGMFFIMIYNVQLHHITTALYTTIFYTTMLTHRKLIFKYYSWQRCERLNLHCLEANTNCKA